MLFALESFPSCTVMTSSVQTLKSGQEKLKILLGEKKKPEGEPQKRDPSPSDMY